LFGNLIIKNSKKKLAVEKDSNENEVDEKTSLDLEKDQCKMDFSKKIEIDEDMYFEDLKATETEETNEDKNR